MLSTRQQRKRPNDEAPQTPRKKAATKTRASTKTAETPKNAKRTTRAATPSSSKSPAVTPRKPTLFDELDGIGSHNGVTNGGSLLHQLEDAESDDDSSLTSMSDADFEDVPVPEGKGKSKVDKKPKLGGSGDQNGDDNDDDDGDDDDGDDDEDIEFEDVQAPAPLPFLSMAMDDGPEPSGDLELTLHKDTRVSLTNPYGEKKGPSKVERLVRNATHCVHVQSLLWHNALRNAWLCDPEVQGLLLSHIPVRLWEEVDRWRRASGLEKPEPVAKAKADGKKRSAAKAGSGSRDKKGKQPSSSDKRPSREWSKAAARLEEGVVDMSHGDPLFRLVRALSAWWRQKFRITAPGLRKKGYVSLERLDRMMKAAKETRGIGPVRFGERVANLAEFRVRAQELSGSRDVGAQLFTALLRGLGLEARMVASLQPLGFGWNKMEDADPEEEEEWAEARETATVQSLKVERKPQTPHKPSACRKPETIEEQDADDSFELAEVNSDNDSVVFVPEPEPEPDTRKQRPVFDKDLQFPHYWTEILSPVTSKYLPVDVLVKNISGTNRELVESLEPRGGKADKARQVMAYVVGYSQDGTAKDVTVRYLKRQTLPGRTKGVRYPVVKVPIYNRYGKVKRYEQVDWFKQAMQGYIRGQRPEHPITEVDETEDATDLRPARPEKKEVKEGEETLQYYKQSKEFVLERHLKREEALVEGAAPVKVFRNSKGKKANGADESAAPENVYLRKDVVSVKSAETWHKQGRAPMAGQLPLKMVPYRAATINRKREIAEAEAATGEKVLQGLYSFEQTDWIIPPPIQNGVIPKNEYGNIDLFAEHMCPQGAVHVPFRGAMRVCKRLQIDFAEAVIDFEFGHRMAVPVIQGVVIAEEHHDHVMEELAKAEAEKARKEDEKRRAAALSQWRKMLMGLRIVERIRQDYGEIRDDERVFGSGLDVVNLDATDGGAETAAEASHEDPDTAGGFLPKGYEYEETEEAPQAGSSSFFPVNEEEDGRGGFDTDEADAGDLVVS